MLAALVVVVREVFLSPAKKKKDCKVNFKVAFKNSEWKETFFVLNDFGSGKNVGFGRDDGTREDREPDFLGVSSPIS